MRPNGATPLSSMDLRRLLRDDRGLDREMRQAIAKSLAMDALAGLVPHRLRLAVEAHRWPVSFIGTDLEPSE